MNYLNDEDVKRFQRHEELEKELSQATDVCTKISDSYYSNDPNKATTDDLIKAQENLLLIWREWKNTLGPMKQQN